MLTVVKNDKRQVNNYKNESTSGAMPRWYTPTMHVRQIGCGSLVINRRGYASQSTSYSSMGGRTVSKLHHALRSIGYLKYLGMVILSLGYGLFIWAWCSLFIWVWLFHLSVYSVVFSFG